MDDVIGEQVEGSGHAGGNVNLVRSDEAKVEVFELEPPLVARDFDGDCVGRGWLGRVGDGEEGRDGDDRDDYGRDDRPQDLKSRVAVELAGLVSWSFTEHHRKHEYQPQYDHEDRGRQDGDDQVDVLDGVGEVRLWVGRRLRC